MFYDSSNTYYSLLPLFSHKLNQHPEICDYKRTWSRLSRK